MTGVPDGLWTAGRSEADLRRLYDGWADRYDADMMAGGMLGPSRVADALRRAVGDPRLPVFDFGCGTGMSGRALRDAGFETVHGADLSEAMLERARATKAYTSLTLTEPDAPVSVPQGVRGVSACGSICIGAGPPRLLPDLLRAMEDGAALVLSYNDDTIRDADYLQAMADVQSAGLARMERAEYGPQLPAMGRGATVYTLTRL